ncbi:MAG: ABC transporter C-terminal domain-containing protein, partial [Thermoleophilia bacterium]
ARLRAVEAAVLRAETRLGEIDAELAEPGTYADRAVLNRLLDERGTVGSQLQREYEAWEELVDEAG